MTFEPSLMEQELQRWMEWLDAPGLAGQLARRAKELWGHPCLWRAHELNHAMQWLSDLMHGDCALWARSADGEESWGVVKRKLVVT